MIKFTLDTNCIIDLEESRPSATYLRELIEDWQQQHMEIAIVAVSASENKKSGFAIPNYSEFLDKISNVGLKDATELHPIAIWDVFYWDHCLWSWEEAERQSIAIKNILFPNAAENAPDDPRENSTWRNQLCDVLVAWSHFHYERDYLVTSDRNFHKKKQSLKSVGVNEIIYPEEAVQLIRPKKRL